MRKDDLAGRDGFVNRIACRSSSCMRKGDVLVAGDNSEVIKRGDTAAMATLG